MAHKGERALTTGKQAPLSAAKKASIFILAAIFLVLLVQSIQKGALRPGGNDLSVYLHAADLFFHGMNPYDAANYPVKGMYFFYPLFTLVIIAPLSLLPPWAAHACWHGVTLFVFWYALLTAMKEVFNVTPGAGFYAAVTILFFDVFQSNFHNAQINMLVVGTSLLFLVFLRRGNTLGAAFFLAAGISLKLSPALFFIYLLINRKYAVMLAVFALLAVLNVLMPLLLAGGPAIGYLADYPRFVLDVLGGGQNSGAADMALKWSKIGALAALSFAALFNAYLRRKGRATYEALLLYFPLGVMGAFSTMQSHYLVWLFPAAVLAGAAYSRIGLRGLARRPAFYFALLFIIAASGLKNHLFASEGVRVTNLMAIYLSFFMFAAWLNRYSASVEPPAAAAGK